MGLSSTARLSVIVSGIFGSCSCSEDLQEKGHFAPVCGYSARSSVHFSFSCCIFYNINVPLEG